MKTLIKKQYLLLFLIIFLSLSFRIFIINFLPINNFPDIYKIAFPLWLSLIFGISNIVLIYFILQRAYNSSIAIIASFLYAISPWSAYIEIISGQYLALLFILLVFLSMVIIFKFNKKISLSIFTLILFAFLYKFNQINLFSDVGLLNTVNEFRGELQQSSFAFFGKIIENRYIYSGLHFLANSLAQFSLANYFTSQIKLTGFSNSSPIYLGFIFPFIYGLYISINKISSFNIIKAIIFFLLLIPSIVSRNSPDLSRLILISPIFFLIIAIGLYGLFLNYKKRIFYLFFWLTILLISIQFLTTISDIISREPTRLKMFLLSS